MKIWRRLQKAGALRFTGSAYLLPWGEEREELCLWLSQEIKSLGGEADFLRVERTAEKDSPALADLFTQARHQAFAAIEQELEALERSLGLPGAAATPEAMSKPRARWRKLKDEHAELTRIDFFPSGKGEELGRRLGQIEHRLSDRRLGATAHAAAATAPKVARRRVDDYQGRLWVTRTRPFVDRMASAWLIRRFIDAQARFGFVADGQPIPPGAVGFDLAGVEFTHEGDLCTFEVLLKAFGLRQKALLKLSQVVHQLDLEDGKYAAPQAQGVEEILRGVRRSADNDHEALEKGISVFEMLHASLA